jgi:hypothetical protein
MSVFATVHSAHTKMKKHLNSTFSPNFTAITLQKQPEPAGAKHVVGYTTDAIDSL